MNKIIPPIQPGQQGPAVLNLQEAMLFIIEKRQLTPNNLSLAEWKQTVSGEMASQSFSERTKRLLAAVIAEVHLPTADFVNDAIAGRLNALLDQLGAFPTPAPPTPAPPTPSPVPPGPTASLSLGSQGPPVAELHTSLRLLGYTISLPESAAKLFGETTRRAVASFQRSHSIASNGVVDEVTAAQIATGLGAMRSQPLVILGLVLREDGTAVTRATVRAFDVDFRQEEPLGENVTDDQGRYAISFSAERFERNEKKTADVVVRVFDENHAELLAESAIFFNVARETVIDLIVETKARRRSEWEKHMATVGELARDVSPAEFTPDDLKFLHGETDIAIHLLAFMVLAHRHGQKTDTAPAAFYGLFRQGLPTNLPALLLTPPRVLRQSLERAVKENVVPAGLSDDLDGILDSLEKARSRVLAGPNGASLPLGQLLDSSGVSANSQEKFLKLYLERSGTLKDFWDSLRNSEQLPAAHVDAFRYTLQLGLLTQNNVSLVKLLQAKARSLRDLVPFDTKDWHAFIKETHGGGVPLPPNLPGNTDDERIASYAEQIVELLQEALPMEYVRHGVLNDTVLPAQQRQDLTAFMSHAPEFDLLETPVDKFLSANDAALHGIADPPSLRIELKRLQRVFRLTLRYKATRTLLSKGWDSALLIAETPFSRFLESVGDDLGGFHKTTAYYKKSKQVAANTAHTYGAIYQFKNDFWPAAIGKSDPQSLDGLPNWEELFGSIDFCKCEHCRSVYGPAAYLVDILQLLRRDGPPFTALMKRRPDLEHLKLTCENTNTPLPYVDLANEIMEFYVVHEAITKDAAKDTGDATAEELSINPKYMDTDAYTALRDAVFSFRLPFNLPVETARVYLEHLGCDVHEVMSVFQNTAGTPKPNDLTVACEYLKITPEEFEVLSGESAEPPRAFFGYTTETVVHKNLDSSTVTESWRANLARVPEFLRRTGLSFSDVADLLKTRFINPVQVPSFSAETVVLFSPEVVCDLNQTWIQRLSSDSDDLDSTGLDEGSWVRIHRFLRLWSKLEWTQQELDRTIVALGAIDIDGPLIEDLARLAWLRSELNQSIVRLLSFWSLIDTFGDDALYLKLFQNKAITNPVDVAFALDEDGTELIDGTAQITEHAATLQAAFRINAEELALLREASGLVSETETLDLGKISLLYRHTLLAKSLKVKIREFLALKVLAGADLFTEPAATVAFVERARRVKASSFKIAELNYLFRHVSEPGKGIAPAEDATIILLQALQKDLLKVVADTQPVADPTSEMLRSKLTLVLEATEAEAAKGLSQATVVDLAMELIEGVPSEGVPSSLSLAEQEQFIDEHFAVFVDPSEAKAALFSPPDPDDDEAKQAHRSFVFIPLLTYLRDLLGRSLVKQTLATALPLEAKMVQFLLEELLAARSDPNLKAIADFLSLGQGVAPADRLLDFIRVYKIALLLGRFKATPEETSYIATHNADFGNFDLNGVPLDRADATAVDNNAASLFVQWEHLHNFFDLRDQLPQADLTLLDMVAAESAAEGRATLSLLTGWDAGDVDFLCSDEGLGVQGDALKNAAGPQRLFAAFALSRKLGISVKQLCHWAQEPLTPVAAQDIVHAVKAKYDDEQWLAAAKLLNDDLREKRKLALTAYLLANKTIVALGIRDSNELYEHFLIDVNMDPCMMTSRVKQAVNSVQLFIQRSLLNLEKGSTLAPESARRWSSWMKNYRLWEANRKVFLYPENWIEPELRDDKSPFFKELETQLLQNDLTPENVEQALMSYLEKLDDVGRLEVCGMHREKNVADGVDSVHIFGRTFNAPHLYFYRRYDVNRNRWSAWERVSVDIEGDHLFPVVWNRRMHLFWSIFVAKPDLEMTRAYLPEGLDPLSQWEIKMAWSEYRQGRWTPKQASSETLFSRTFLFVDDPAKAFYFPTRENHYFRTAIDQTGSGLTIVCARRFLAEADLILASGDIYFLEGHEIVGEFAFTGCRGRAEIGLTQAGSQDFNSRHQPDDTLNVAMVCNSAAANLKAAGTDLTLQDTKKTKVLGELDSPFDFLPPQEIADLGKAFYPFVFQDFKRAYFAMPTLDDPRQVRQVFANPFVDIQAEIEDPIVSQIPLPDKGDPAPFGFGHILRPFIQTFTRSDTHLPSLRVMKGADGSALLVQDQRMTSGLVTVQELGAPSQPVTKKSSQIGPAQEPGAAENLTVQEKAKVQALYLKFHVFFHPHVCGFIKTLNHLGVTGLLTLDSQELDNDPKNDTVFDNVYDPAPIVHDDYPQEDVDFRPEGAYSLYNWELFFHAPLLIADRLSASQRFEDAMKWFHYIFDPTNGSADDTPAKYWRFLPFHINDENDRIEELLEKLNHGTPSEKKKLIQLVEDWRDNPFNPHLIARSRMIAYQKTVVMKYLENVISWGDQLFARDTIESINEATQLYVLAYHILGRRPERIPPRLKPKDKTYADLKPFLDAFSNAMIELENVFPFSSVEDAISNGQDTGAESLGTTPSFYFCIPPNDKLLSYWDTVEDRLFKIRHCMNIEGAVRELPLFEPPIDPALLVKAAAAGLDLSSVLADTQAPLTPYRFQFLSQRATELCAEVESLGQALLSILEKKDAEALSALRAGHETSLLEAAREAKRQYIQEARRQREALANTRKVTEERQSYYQQRLAQPLNQEEQTQLNKLSDAHQKQGEASNYEEQARYANLLPMFMTSSLGLSAGAAVLFGGQNVGAMFSAFARSKADDAADATYEANSNAIRGGQARRSEEWTLQLALATKELAQIDKQIAASEIRMAIAENDLSTHDTQIEKAKVVEEFLRNKYTNEELYGWMLSQISAVYFQSYKLAYDTAKRAERAFRFERGVTDSSFIQFGYWDSFTKGLLAGDKLLLDLKRMEAAYVEQNRREQEITKHVSLMLHDPLKLIQLKETGRCEVELAEPLFDTDFPGHYLRRIKSVSITIPCVIGPYTSVNCTLTLLSNKTRIKNVPAAPYEENEDGDVMDNRFVRDFAAIHSIVTSHAQNDSGLFELNFRDERYLPFEGSGAVSRWRIELPEDFRQFDYDTISDVILHMQYTARGGGAALHNAAVGSLRESLEDEEGQPQARLFSLRHEFPSEWQRLRSTAESNGDHSQAFPLAKHRFPYVFQCGKITVNRVELFGIPKSREKNAPEPELLVTLIDPEGQQVELQEAAPVGLLGHRSADVSVVVNNLDGGEAGVDWTLKVAQTDLPVSLERLEDILVLCQYSVQMPTDA
jgi:peptidoglycan hydrolase-like protein with peptidoglycan-binding domain